MNGLLTGLLAAAFRSDLGWFAIAFSEGDQGPKLRRLVFGHPDESGALGTLVGQEPCDRVGIADTPADVQRWAVRLTDYASGAAVDLSSIPLDTSHLTTFGARVLSQCRKIAYGRTMSYGQLAAAVGRAGAARAVGSVMAKNRTPLVAPCHRVLGAGGRLGGFSAPQGVAMKRRLLDMEQRGLF